MTETDTNYYAREIRRLAAVYQSGEILSKGRKDIEDIIRSMQATPGYDSDYQAAKWSELFNALSAFSTNTADPKWKSVIAYARCKVSCKKHPAIFRCKRAGK